LTISLSRVMTNDGGNEREGRMAAQEAKVRVEAKAPATDKSANW